MGLEWKLMEWAEIKKFQADYKLKHISFFYTSTLSFLHFYHYTFLTMTTGTYVTNVVLCFRCFPLFTIIETGVMLRYPYKISGRLAKISVEDTAAPM